MYDSCIMSNNITKVLLGATVSLGAMAAPLALADEPAPAAEAWNAGFLL